MRADLSHAKTPRSQRSDESAGQQHQVHAGDGPLALHDGAQWVVAGGDGVEQDGRNRKHRGGGALLAPRRPGTQPGVGEGGEPNQAERPDLERPSLDAEASRASRQRFHGPVGSQTWATGGQIRRRSRTWSDRGLPPAASTWASCSWCRACSARVWCAGVRSFWGRWAAWARSQAGGSFAQSCSQRARWSRKHCPSKQSRRIQSRARLPTQVMVTRASSCGTPY